AEVEADRIPEGDRTLPRLAYRRVGTDPEVSPALSRLARRDSEQQRRHDQCQSQDGRDSRHLQPPADASTVQTSIGPNARPGFHSCVGESFMTAAEAIRASPAATKTAPVGQR